MARPGRQRKVTEEPVVADETVMTEAKAIEPDPVVPKFEKKKIYTVTKGRSISCKRGGNITGEIKDPAWVGGQEVLDKLVDKGLVKVS